jgi:hypothetical protein
MKSLLESVVVALIFGLFVASLVIGCSQDRRQEFVETVKGLVGQYTAHRPGTVAEKDVRSATAQEMADEIRKQDAKILTLSEETARAAKVSREITALMELNEIESLRRAFREAAASAHELEEVSILLDRNLRHATKAYGAAAMGYMDRAQDYKDPKFREACIGWSQFYDNQGRACPLHRERLATLRREIPGTIELIRESGKLLDDYYLFVKTSQGEVIPDELTRGKADTIRKYAEKFRDFESAIDRYKSGKGEVEKVAPPSTSEAELSAPPAA